ncbi:MAG: chromate transporter [Burkholderiaceae bacterium]
MTDFTSPFTSPFTSWFTSWFTSALSIPELLALTLHFMLLSLLGVGGAISTAPDMQRYVVLENRWITESQFTASIAMAQAAPGPNVLFVAVIGWNVAGLWGVLATMTGCLLPSTTLTLFFTRWGERRRDLPALRAFTCGMAPLSLGLLAATGWVLAEPFVREPSQRWGALALVGVTLITMLRSTISPMWLVALGAVVGVAGGL